MNFSGEELEVAGDQHQWQAAGDVDGNSFLHHDVFDINAWIPQTPFYDFPFATPTSDHPKPQDQRSHLSSSSSSSSPPKSVGQTPSRSLLSERRRRNNMKEKLLALRSLVPNITKMDKASIVSDAVSYVEELMITSRNLEEEISRLEEDCEYDIAETQKSDDKKILQMVVIRTDNCQFYVKVLLKKGKPSVVAGLLEALESFENMMVHTINLAAHEEFINLAFTVQVTECEEKTSEADLKLLLLANFLNKGFRHSSNAV